MDELIADLRQGRHRAIARLMTQLENDETAAREIISKLHGETGRAHIIGLTGAPGSGKSTLTTQIARQFRQRGQQVAIIAVDPSSPFSGGAVLGDRIRMRALSGDEGVFIRSLASRGRLGGLAAAAGGFVRILDAAGFPIILVETVGAGQAEVDIAGLAHTTLVIEAPGMGDDIQSSKAGILEIADILVVNKADRPTVKQTVRALQAMLSLGHRQSGQSWQVPVLQTIATSGEGVVDLVTHIQEHLTYLRSSGLLFERELGRSQQEIELLARELLWRRLLGLVTPQRRAELAEAVAARARDPYSAAAELAAALK